jgi:excisionase family DNA binding protein
MKQLYTTHDVSRLLQVDPSTVTKWADRGLMLAFRTPGGHRRIRAHDLRSFLITHQMPVPAELGRGLVRLLVVDQDKPELDAVRRAFRPFAAALEISTTTSSVEAMLMIPELQPHGLLIELDMPYLDGLHVCRHILAHPRLARTKAFTTSARRTAGAVARSRAAGAVACLQKPIAPDPVLAAFRVPIALAQP